MHKSTFDVLYGGYDSFTLSAAQYWGFGKQYLKLESRNEKENALKKKMKAQLDECRNTLSDILTYNTGLYNFSNDIISGCWKYNTRTHYNYLKFNFNAELFQEF